MRQVSLRLIGGVISVIGRTRLTFDDEQGRCHRTGDGICDHAFIQTGVAYVQFDDRQVPTRYCRLLSQRQITTHLQSGEFKVQRLNTANQLWLSPKIIMLTIRRRIFISTVGNNINNLRLSYNLVLSLVHYTFLLQNATRGAMLNKAGRPLKQNVRKWILELRLAIFWTREIGMCNFTGKLKFVNCIRSVRIDSFCLLTHVLLSLLTS